MKIDGCLARNIDFEVANLEVLKKNRRKAPILKPRSVKIGGGFPVAALCLWGKLQNLSFSKVSKQVVISFCVAGAALCDIPNLFGHVSKVLLCGRRNTSRSFHKMSCSFRGRRSLSSICVASAAQHFRHVALSALHSTLHTQHSTLYTPHFTLHTLHSTLHT